MKNKNHNGDKMHKDIEYLDSPEKISADMVPDFFVGWPNPPDKKIFIEILKNSHKIVIAKKGNNIIGFITAISDGILSAYIPFLEVLPDFQNKGIGAELMHQMKEKLKNIYMVDLICDSSLEGYYKKLGFTKSSGMILRNYEFQNGKRNK